MSDRMAVRLYRRLLLLFPPGFRRARGPEMEELFLATRRDLEDEGGRRVARFWAAILWDTGTHAVAEWLGVLREWMGPGRVPGNGEPMATRLNDLKYAFRQLTRQPLYSVMVVTLMALGIAGNAAVFRVFNGLFLKPLPFENPEQLVDLDETAPAWDLEFLNIAYRDFAAWRDQNRTFQSMMVYRNTGGNFIGDGAATRVSALQTTHTAAEVFGIEPALGRFFGPEEDTPDGPLAAVLTHAFWEQEYGSDREVLGRVVSINGSPHEIIGVLPPEAGLVTDVDLWTPMQATETEFHGWGLNGVGRLRPGVTVDQALQDLTRVHKGMIEQFEENEISSPVVTPLRDRFLGQYRLGSGFLLGAVGVVLLIASANIAGLMTVRSMTRAPEIAVRLAMGAPRGRIVSQLLTESMLLAVLGAGMGLLLGIWGSAQLVAPLAEQMPSFVTFELDGLFFAFTAAVTAVAGLLFGVVPALQASSASPDQVSSGRSTLRGRQRRSMNWLVGGEVALATALLVVGGLSMLDVQRLGQVDPGFADDGVMTFAVSLPQVRYPDDETRLAFADEFLAELRALPGIESAAAASTLPLRGHWGWFFQTEGAPPRAGDEADPVVLNRVVDPGYFETLGVRIIEGRGFDEFDGRDGHVVVVNETFVRTHLSHLEDPVGARLTAGTGLPRDDAPRYTVIGVAADVKHYGLDEEMRPGLYQPLQQLPLSSPQFALRTRGDAGPAIAAARTAVASIDVELPLFQVGSLTEAVEDSLFTRRATSWMIAAFAVVALLLAMAGIYGVISYTVRQRTQEISIRMAMGAQKEQVLKQVLRQGMTLAGIGVVLGLGASLAGAEVVSGILVGVNVREPMVYLGVTVVISLVAVLANVLPARRAANLDPMNALRGDG